MPDWQRAQALRVRRRQPTVAKLKRRNHGPAVPFNVRAQGHVWGRSRGLLPIAVRSFGSLCQQGGCVRGVDAMAHRSGSADRIWLSKLNGCTNTGARFVDILRGTPLRHLPSIRVRPRLAINRWPWESRANTCWHAARFEGCVRYGHVSSLPRHLAHF